LTSIIKNAHKVIVANAIENEGKISGNTKEYYEANKENISEYL